MVEDAGGFNSSFRGVRQVASRGVRHFRIEFVFVLRVIANAKESCLYKIVTTKCTCFLRYP